MGKIIELECQSCGLVHEINYKYSSMKFVCDCGKAIGFTLKGAKFHLEP
jgi:hypothetical protein